MNLATISRHLSRLALKSYFPQAILLDSESPTDKGAGAIRCKTIKYLPGSKITESRDSPPRTGICQPLFCMRKRCAEARGELLAGERCLFTPACTRDARPTTSSLSRNPTARRMLIGER